MLYIELTVCTLAVICDDGITTDISEPDTLSGPRSLTLRVRSDVLEGVSDVIVIVSRGSEHVNKEEMIVVSLLFCTNLTYAT